MGIDLIRYLTEVHQKEYNANIGALWLATLQALVAIGTITTAETVQKNAAMAQAILQQLPTA